MRPFTRRPVVGILSSLILSMMGVAASAQTAWPTKPVKILGAPPTSWRGPSPQICPKLLASSS
jgi:hypothetical protein